MITNFWEVLNSELKKRKWKNIALKLKNQSSIEIKIESFIEICQAYNFL